MSLTPKVYELLLLLVENSGHMLKKEELMRALWPDSFVEEGNLTRNISMLRAALGENPDHRYIETVPKRGYRFIGEVRESQNGNIESLISPTSEMNGALAKENTSANINDCLTCRSDRTSAVSLSQVPADPTGRMLITPSLLPLGLAALTRRWNQRFSKLVHDKLVHEIRRRWALPASIVVLTVTIVLVWTLLHWSKSINNGNGPSPYFGINLPLEGQVMRYPMFEEPETLDPQESPDSPTSLALFDGLVEYKEYTTDPQPSLAESWDVKADSTLWIFHLRHNARWSDGEPLTAKDFLYSWRRALNPHIEPAIRNAFMMYHIKNAEAYHNESAFIYDAVTGKYATEADLAHARKGGKIVLTGGEPRKFTGVPILKHGLSTPEPSYLLVPVKDDERQKLFTQNPLLAQVAKEKKLVPITQDYLGLRLLDDYTLEVTLKEPEAYFIKVLLDPIFRPVPRQSIEKWGDTQWAKPGHIITSGAFIVSEWVPSQKIVVNRNTVFWDNFNTKLDRIIFLLLKERVAALDLYKEGKLEATYAGQIPVTLRNQLQLKEKKDYLTAPFALIGYLSINTTTAPFNDVNVRRALSMAINRQNIANQLTEAQPFTGFVPLMVGYQVAKGTDFNPQKARDLLSAAGFPEGRGFPEIELSFVDHIANRRVMEAAQGMLQAELGVRVTLVGQSWRDVLRSRSALAYKGLSLCMWKADYVDPSNFLGLLADANNNTGWWDPKLNELLRSANAEKDPDRRGLLLRGVEKSLLEAQPVIPLFLSNNSLMRKPYVRNFEPNLLDRHYWRGVYIDHSVPY